MAEWFREHLGSGDRLVVTTNTDHTGGFGSCDLVALMPDVESDEYIPAMLELCRRVLGADEQPDECRENEAPHAAELTKKTRHSAGPRQIFCRPLRPFTGGGR